MDALGPALTWISSVFSQVAPASQAVAPVIPIPVATPAPSPVTLGLKVLLEPTAGGVIFRAASNTVATIYPVYASAKAIESKDTADDVQWLTYWTLYGSLILAEHLADQALGRVPYYYHAKFAALLWLQLPQTQGAAYLYKRFYKPALVKYGPRIDFFLDKCKSVLMALYSTYKVPIDASVALLLALQQQAATTLSWLLSDDSAAKKGGTDGSKDRVKAHAA
ncbi:hypothetical protein VOLCADRAFT_104090 [Volvox carteri f. nagariensis]|uniref:HVA22-like protein n=1 Tax=Volvox carteri f. nagariensis TaxID=3068 RepID=D8TR69_VOLCA|nr:uncharacterized protein VOLCADRAFT_104090 [Volvox carteri f. nagariensis]EFJ49839.1 hypothetical protein VOLCADRAFT_104090 [Volvox carteri f. nagariensis]|eukprot:XP_002948904.1 hypothetical protein VOLCADRAFT_104090 [Volvox carteri f. nagariensis]